MTNMERGQVKRESGPTGIDEEAEARATQDWLRLTDKPLTKENQDGEDPEPRDE